MKWIATVLVLAAGSYLGWMYYQGTPSYSVAQIDKAVATNDVYLFRKHVDTQAVVKDMLQGAMGNFDEAVGNGEDEPEWMNALGKGIVAALMPAITNYIADEIEEYIKTGEEPFTEFGNVKKNQDGGGEAPPLGTEQASSNFNLDQFQDPEFSFEEKGTVTLLIVNHLNPKLGKRYDLVFAMQGMDGYWKVVGIDNARDYFEQQREDEAALLEEINKPIRKQLDEGMSFALNSLRVERPYFSTVVSGQITAKNQSTEPIAAANYLLTVSEADRLVVYREPIELIFNPPLQPNDQRTNAIQLRLNSFISVDKIFAEIIETEGMNSSANAVSISYASGDMVELFEKLPAN